MAETVERLPLGQRPPAAPSNRIRTLALWGEILCLIALATAVCALAAALISPAWRDNIMFGGMQINNGPPLPLSEETRHAMVFLALPAVACQSLALFMGWQLFRGYRRGDIFTVAAANRLNWIGWIILATAPVGVFTRIMLGRMISGSVQGSTGFSMAFSPADIDVTSIAFGLLAMIVGRVLGEAVKVAEENRSFV
jgi:Protein of unknown function (DUF2975)